MAPIPNWLTLWWIISLLTCHASAFDENDVVVPDHTFWVCDTFSPSSGFTVSHDSRSSVRSESSGLLKYGNTAMAKEFQKGHNKFLLAIQIYNPNDNFIKFNSFGIARKNSDYSILKQLGSDKYTFNGLEQKSFPDIGELEAGDIFYVMLDMDEGKVGFKINNGTAMVIEDPIFMKGSWHFQMESLYVGATMLHNPNGCEHPDYRVLSRESIYQELQLFNGLLKKFNLSLAFGDQLEEVAFTSKEFDLEKVLIAAAASNPKKLLALSEQLASNESISEYEAINELMEIYLTPEIPSIACSTNHNIQTVAQNKQAEVVFNIVSMADLRRIKKAEAKAVLMGEQDEELIEQNEELSENHLNLQIQAKVSSISNLIYMELMAYPSESFESKESLIYSLRDSIYAKLNDIFNFIRLDRRGVVSYSHSQIRTEVMLSDKDLDELGAEILESVQWTLGRPTNNTELYEADELVRVRLLQEKYADIGF